MLRFEIGIVYGVARCFNDARCDCVRGNPERTKLDRYCLGKREDSRLANHVVRSIGFRKESVTSRDVNDPPKSPFFHPREHTTIKIKRSMEIGTKDLMPIIDAYVEERLVMPHTDVGDGNVDAA